MKGTHYFRWEVVARVQKSYRVGVSDPAGSDFPQYGYRFLNCVLSYEHRRDERQVFYNRFTLVGQGNAFLLDGVVITYALHIPVVLSAIGPVRLKTKMTSPATGTICPRHVKSRSKPAAFEVAAAVGRMPKGILVFCLEHPPCHKGKASSVPEITRFISLGSDFAEDGG